MIRWLVDVKGNNVRVIYTADRLRERTEMQDHIQYSIDI